MMKINFKIYCSIVIIWFLFTTYLLVVAKLNLVHMIPNNTIMIIWFVTLINIVLGMIVITIWGIDYE